MKAKRTRTLAFALSAASLIACGGGNKGPGEDWSERPLKAAESTVKGVSFSITLPDKMTKDDTGTDIAVGWRSAKSDYFSEPSGWVAPGRYLPGAPTDPYVRDYRIRLLGSGVRCVP